MLLRFPLFVFKALTSYYESLRNHPINKKESGTTRTHTIFVTYLIMKEHVLNPFNKRELFYLCFVGDTFLPFKIRNKGR